MPSSFVWGAATSAHQVEGGNLQNDWWYWERQGPARIQSGKACEHYTRFREDFALAKQLGHTAHRLSLEWSRIEVAPGKYHQPALSHYRDVLQELRRQGLASFVTLHHFTNPLWLARQGGWGNPRTALWFRAYVEQVLEALGDLVDYWITINEPNIYVLKGYWEGSWPPGKYHKLYAMRNAYTHLAIAHEQAYQTIHHHTSGAKVGIAQNMIAWQPASRASRQDRAAAALCRYFYNDYFFERTRGTHDFIGVNYYLAARKKFSWHFPYIADEKIDLPRSDMGWPLYPEGLTQVLLEAKRYHRPIYVTENGIASARDDHRSAFIQAHIRAIEAAQAQGADVRGYLHWSLLDNFEWADGYPPKFGLVGVDFATQQRRIRPSAYVYKAIIKQARQ